jgi:hypothetical protein
MTEPIPGMADRIRETLKRRAGNNGHAVHRIESLTNDQVYAQAPNEAIDLIVRSSPKDKGDIQQWLAYRDEASRALGIKEINEWVSNLQSVHGVGPIKRRSA